MRRLLLLLASLCGAWPVAAQGGRLLPTEPPLYYETVGRQGPLVVVLHGGPGIPHDYLRPEWDRLSDSARVVYYDQRGCGRSGRVPPYGWRTHVLDLDRLLQALSPTEPVVLAGSSWGVMLALYYATLHPARVRALILSGVTQGVEYGGKALSPEWLARVPTARWDSVAQGMSVGADVRPVGGLDPRLAPRVREYCWDIQGLVNLSWPDAPSFEAFGAVRVPTLIVRGGDPRNLAADDGARLAAQLPGAQLMTIAGAGHDPWLDRPAEFFGAAFRFLHTLAIPNPDSPRP